MIETGQPVQAPAEADQYADEFVQDEYEMGPAQEAQYEAYTDNATLAVFSEKSQAQVLQLLQSGQSGVEGVAEAAFRINKQMVAIMEQSGEKPTEITLCMGGAHLVSELIALAGAAGLYELNEEERKQAFGLSIQKFFEDGFEIYSKQGADAPGAIDPVKTQKTFDSLLSPEQRQYGLQMAKEQGISLTEPPTGLFANYQDSGGMASQGQSQAGPAAQQQQVQPQGMLAQAQQGGM